MAQIGNQILGRAVIGGSGTASSGPATNVRTSFEAVEVFYKNAQVRSSVQAVEVFYKNAQVRDSQFAVEVLIKNAVGTQQPIVFIVT